MSNKKHIDDLFRDGISGYKVSPDKETWQKIEDAYFTEKAGAARWIYYSAAAVLLLLLLIGGWYFGPGEEFVPDQAINTSSEELTIDKTENYNTAPSETKSDETTTTVKTDRGEEHSPVQNASDKQATALFSDDANGKNTVTQDKIKAANESFSLIIPEDESTYSPSIYKDIAFLNSIDLSLNLTTEPALIDPEKVKGMQAYLDKKKKSHFYTGLSATAGMMYYPSTKDQFTWSADLAFGLTAGKFYFETGVGYQAMKEQGIYTIEFKSNDSIGYYNEVLSFEVNPSNPDEIIYKTDEVTVYDSINHYTHATPTFKYNYFNIPIIVGYKIFERKKLSLGVETGLLFSFLTSEEIPQVSFHYPEYTHVKTINETPERVEFNYRWQLAVRLNYRFARSMSVAVKPVFTKYLNSVYDTDKGYPNVKPYSMGIQVGLYYGF